MDTSRPEGRTGGQVITTSTPRRMRAGLVPMALLSTGRGDQASSTCIGGQATRTISSLTSRRGIALTDRPTAGGPSCIRLRQRTIGDRVTRTTLCPWASLCGAVRTARRVALGDQVTSCHLLTAGDQVTSCHPLATGDRAPNCHPSMAAARVTRTSSRRTTTDPVRMARLEVAQRQEVRYRTQRTPADLVTKTSLTPDDQVIRTSRPPADQATPTSASMSTLAVPAARLAGHEDQVVTPTTTHTGSWAPTAPGGPVGSHPSMKHVGQAGRTRQLASSIVDPVGVRSPP